MAQRKPTLFEIISGGKLSPSERVALHALQHLPDSLEERCAMLQHIADSLSDRNSEVRQTAFYLLRQLREHQKQIKELQPELPLAKAS